MLRRFGPAGKPDRTATHVHRQWFNIDDLRFQLPPPPLPFILASVPGSKSLYDGEKYIL